ncbi:hypothetical protein [Acidianus ambivalens]|uniref:hypothetical protein n=1 Tax=Acidianus ambivalens TaxID=2283 RepID=UPI001E599F92|nr:hypothetical protein [Acidianus ambivalens]
MVKSALAISSAAIDAKVNDACCPPTSSENVNDHKPTLEASSMKSLGIPFSSISLNLGLRDFEK